MINVALSDFWYILNANILVSSKGIVTLKNLYFHIFFYAIQGSFFVAKESRQFRQQKSPWCLEVMPLNNADSLLQDNAIVVVLQT